MNFQSFFGASRAPGELNKRVRTAQAVLPPLIALVVVAYQLLVVQIEPGQTNFWAALLFYGIVGPLVTFFVLSWITAEVRERERAEAELRNLYSELTESHARLAAVQRVTRNVSEAGDLESVMETAIASVAEAVGAKAGAIILESGVVRSFNISELPLEITDLEPLRVASGVLDRPSSIATAKSRLSSPLRYGERFLGAMHLYFAGIPPTPSRELFEILAGEMAVALDAASIRTRDLLTLFEVDKSIRAEINLERLLENVLTRIRERVRADASAVYLADEDGRLSLAWGRESRDRGRGAQHPRFGAADRGDGRGGTGKG
ncbi:MAG: hypothetical protein ACK41E_00460, partial [Deinococcales bacterium]